MLKPTAVLCLALALLPLAACGDDTPRGQIQVTDLRLVRQQVGYPELSGLVINRTERAIVADLGVRLMGPNNLPIGDLERFTVNNVAPGDSARFRRRLDIDARGARLDYVIPG